MCMQTSLFLSHGTPWLTVKKNSYTDFLKEYATQHEKPSAIVLISSLWTRDEQAVAAIVKEHEVNYSFTCCPQEAYEITYPAPGNIELSDRLLTLLSTVRIFAEFAENQPLDYGGWVPLQIMYPEADIPVVSLSLNPALPFRKQYEIGKALRPLKEENVLIIASGGFVHNIEHIRYDMSIVEGWAIHFMEWIEEQIVNWDLEALFQFKEQAPFAMDAVPNIAELIPLMIAMGTGDRERKAEVLHRSFQFGNVSLSAVEFI